MDRRLIRTRVVACVTTAAALTIAGCGVPPQGEPDVVNRRDVPFGLTQDEPHPTAPSTTIPVTPDTQPKR